MLPTAELRMRIWTLKKMRHRSVYFMKNSHLTFPDVSSAKTIKTVCVMKAWPYCVLAVSIDQLQQLALELLQGRLKGDGKSVQGEGQRFERLRLQQSIS